ncbi:MAG: SDR family NAD(P)-dependent oxidoreductase [Kordiimonadaceae bacterium]|nr:SDR family NAD(P)-dependent oxidoreductase [Kordiimonadaceae bacterium]MBO6567795.1 SDR family NAD(P)-dependent oxidoreductase [Kordiimonadaceae bacterium]MBO6962990.1 SDR family NAD(P)-dependent oxidoreductase [Kordiimonadaceae bacterium]
MAAEDQKKLGSPFGHGSTALEVVDGIDLNGKRAVVTGGYSGLGLETVRALVRAGAHVTVPARRPDVAAEAVAEFGSQARVAKLDLSDVASATAFGADFVEDGQPLDILINNAGIMACPETRVGPGWELQFATNHLGHFAMTKALLPALLKSAAPRVVSLSSAAHKRSDILWDDVHFENGTYEKWTAYGQAKTANALFALGLHQRYAGEGLLATSVHPGGIMTPLQRHLPNEEMMAFGWTDENGKLTEQAAKIFKTPAGGAATSIWCATSSLLEGHGGVYCEDCDVADLQTEESPRFVHVAPWAVNDESAAKLWDMTEGMLS